MVTNGHGHVCSNAYADDGDLADAGNGTQPLIAAFDTEFASTRRRVTQEKRDCWSVAVSAETLIAKATFTGGEAAPGGAASPVGGATDLRSLLARPGLLNHEYGSPKERSHEREIQSIRSSHGSRPFAQHLRRCDGTDQRLRACDHSAHERRPLVLCRHLGLVGLAPGSITVPRTRKRQALRHKLSRHITLIPRATPAKTSLSPSVACQAQAERSAGRTSRRIPGLGWRRRSAGHTVGNADFWQWGTTWDFTIPSTQSLRH